MNHKTNRNILIAVDASENSRRAVQYVADLLGGIRGFKVSILHVIREPEEDEFAVEADKEKWYIIQHQEANRMLEEYRRILLDADFAPDDVNVRSTLKYCPSMAECILAERDLYEYNTLVVGRKGLSHKEEFLFGSVSGKIVRIARDCTVWVVE
jgi:nucleotide-binding universal stress UspA family protein